MIFSASVLHGAIFARSVMQKLSAFCLSFAEFIHTSHLLVLRARGASVRIWKWFPAVDSMRICLEQKHEKKEKKCKVFARRPWARHHITPIPARFFFYNSSGIISVVDLIALWSEGKTPLFLSYFRWYLDMGAQYFPKSTELAWRKREAVGARQQPRVTVLAKFFHPRLSG